METKGRAEAEEPATVRREVLRFEPRRGFLEPIKDDVVTERHVELYIDNELHTTFSCSSGQVRELAAGHLPTEGIIGELGEIMKLEAQQGKVFVSLAEKTVTRVPGKPQRILTSCGSRTVRIPARFWVNRRKAGSDKDFRLSPDALSKAVMALNTRAFVFRKTGGPHASALLDEKGEVLAFSEDIGRHNAIDKVIGKALLDGVDLKRAFLASTGRLTSEMVIKAVYAGVPVVVSISAPTDKGAKIAEMSGLTLIGFARGRRFNVYANPERIVT